MNDGKGYTQLDIPVAIIVFNRIDCAVELIASVSKSRPSKLYIIADGPRTEEEKKLTNDVRSYVEAHVDWPCEVVKVYSDVNLGCDERSVSGYNYVFEHEECAILIEDDAIPTDEFYTYARQMLREYASDERIWMITGENTYPDYDSSGRDYYFSAMPAKKAWATWRRAWIHMDPHMEIFDSNQLGSLTRGYPLSAKIYYCSAYLGAYNGGSAWDVKWDYAMAVNDGLGIVPTRNMVHEIGYNRDDATHTKEDSVNAHLSLVPYGRPLNMRQSVEHDIDYDREYLAHAFRGSIGFLIREYVLYILTKYGFKGSFVKCLRSKDR